MCRHSRRKFAVIDRHSTFPCSIIWAKSTGYSKLFKRRWGKRDKDLLAHAISTRKFLFLFSFALALAPSTTNWVTTSLSAWDPCNFRWNPITTVFTSFGLWMKASNANTIFIRSYYKQCCTRVFNKLPLQKWTSETCPSLKDCQGIVSPCRKNTVQCSKLQKEHSIIYSKSTKFYGKRKLIQPRKTDIFRVRYLYQHKREHFSRHSNYSKFQRSIQRPIDRGGRQTSTSHACSQFVAHRHTATRTHTLFSCTQIQFAYKIQHCYLYSITAGLWRLRKSLGPRCVDFPSGSPMAGDLSPCVHREYRES